MRSPIILCLICFLSAASAEINGSVETIGEIRVVNLWGTWEEMGYAHGYLLGPDLMELYEGYFLELAGGLSNVELLRANFNSYFTVPVEFSDYASGIIAGAADTISIWSPVYGRDLDALDIYITSSVPDLSAMVDFPQLLCSSASAWGDATYGDPVLNGTPAVSRNLDYYVDLNGSILEMSRLFVYEPAEGQDWVSVSFPGFMGSLSGMNESGVNASLNMGNYQGTTQTYPSFVPICMALTLGLCREDFDGSGSHDILDLMSAVTFWNRANSYDIHITSPPALSAGGNPAVVAEVNNQLGFQFRYSSDEPSIAPDHLLLTNHHRILYPPVSCYRYAYMLDSLDADPDVTLPRLWNFMRAVGFSPEPGSGGTLQTMIFQPSQRRLGLAFASQGIAAPEKSPQWIEWNDIYPNHDPQGIQEGQPGISMFLLQNPAESVVSVYADEPVSLSLYDLGGRLMDVCFIQTSANLYTADVSHLPSSVYAVHARSGESSDCLEVLVLD